ncbi:hypothetical protein V6N12_007127 [Hibiscus sabdariffa]|uniref:Uncharacterized protein n=1 Tax=Hibiscus sabdariffa TaxID=183260 RepID=A0ABR2F0W4_9ROSI
MERAAILEKEVNLEGADKQFEENEEVKEYHCEVEKAGCDHHVEVGGRSCIDADKGIAKKSWAEVLIDHRPTQSLAQTESFLDLGPHSKNLFSKVNVEFEAGGEDLESGLLGQHAGKEIIQLEEVQSPKPIEGTGRDAALSSVDNFGEMETLSPKTRASKKCGSLCEIQDRSLSKVEKKGEAMAPPDARLKLQTIKIQLSQAGLYQTLTSDLSGSGQGRMQDRLWLLGKE